MSLRDDFITIHDITSIDPNELHLKLPSFKKDHFNEAKQNNLEVSENVKCVFSWSRSNLKPIIVIISELSTNENQ